MPNTEDTQTIIHRTIVTPLGINYLFIGFQPPINASGNSKFASGKVIPIKIRFVDANLQSVPDAKPEVWLKNLSSAISLGEENAATSVSSADTGCIMRYVPADGHYIYNWDLGSLNNGCYEVFVRLYDSPTCSKNPYSVLITVDKKGKK
ncbi:MAG: PxKF domain-containing protein [Candidatus Loosdrechtia sp.]|uniref:PxKF domain-containing protein n=1 Tax=Candidatus Loosdrechtia sp. TaxID=3101272 RepID=UPI003A5E981D|nr:MAG: PxKF domain-containing protein [Candidatus Jettenia sp. AMX2]